MNLRKKIFLILISLLVLKSSAYAATGAATEYKITMTYLVMCEDGSSLATCKNPVKLGSGESGGIDIANTAAGATAARYGSLVALKAGIKYTHMKVTMKRAITIKGNVGSCYTKTGNNGTASATAAGSTSSGDLGSTTAYMAVVGTGNGDGVRSAAESNGSGEADAGEVEAGHEYFNYTMAISPIVITTRIPVTKLAFGTSNALGLANTCTSTSLGLYGAEPDVNISFQ